MCSVRTCVCVRARIFMSCRISDVCARANAYVLCRVEIVLGGGGRGRGGDGGMRQTNTEGETEP